MDLHRDFKKGPTHAIKAARRINRRGTLENLTMPFRHFRSKTSPLSCIAHEVGRIKSAAPAGTAQTWICRCDTLSRGSGVHWRTPLRHSFGLLGPAYYPVRKAGYPRRIVFRRRICLRTIMGIRSKTGDVPQMSAKRVTTSGIV